MTEIFATVKGPSGSEELKFLVDTGAMFTLLPADVWPRLGLEPEREEQFSLADATHIRRSMSECRIELANKGTLHTPVILGEPGDTALLGVMTLEAFGLMVNPLTRELQPMLLRL